MRPVQKSVWQFALVLGLAPSAWAADDLLTAKLIDEAHHWQEKNRNDLAAIAWRKVLLATPKHPEALSQLRAISGQPQAGGNGNLAEPARQAGGPTRVVDTRETPGITRVFQGSSSMMYLPPKQRIDATLPPSIQTTSVPPSAVAPIRDVPRSGAPVAKQTSVVSHRFDASDAKTLPSAVPVDNWARTRLALETAAQNHPSSVPEQIALARHLGTREATRRESLRQMTDFARRGMIDESARKSWRTALMELQPRSGNEIFFAGYLGYYPDDAAVRERAASLTMLSKNGLADATSSIAQTRKGQLSTDALNELPPVRTTTSKPTMIDLRLSPSLSLPQESNNDAAKQ